MDQNILTGVTIFLMALFIVQAVRHAKRMKEFKELKKKFRNLIGAPIEKLKDGVVYYRFPTSAKFVLLSENSSGKGLKSYILNLDIEKLPDAFMYLEEGRRAIPWEPVDLYEEDVDVSADLQKFSDEIIELKELAGKQPD